MACCSLEPRIATPPGSPPEAYDQVVSTAKSVVESRADEDHIFLAGDFNRPTEWITDSKNPMLLRPFSCTDVDEDFFDELATLGLSQICGVKARNQLELVFTNADTDKFTLLATF